MGTKNKPGNFDCYANADPDEPMFILLGRDPFAPALVDMWAASRAIDGEVPAKTDEAIHCADAMREWLTKLGKHEKKLLIDKLSIAEGRQDFAHEIIRALDNAA